MPRFVMILPESIRYVSAIPNTTNMASVVRCVIVADNGFFSADTIKKLKKKHLSYIAPLRSNSSIIPESEDFLYVLMYNGKPVK